VNRVAISIQTLNGRKDVYLRKEVGTMNKRAILEAVEAMLDDQPGHNDRQDRPEDVHPGRSQQEGPGRQRGRAGHVSSEDTGGEHDR
jgi:hypothetical protein